MHSNFKGYGCAFLAAAAAALASGEADAATLWFTAIDQGWYSDTGHHDPNNENYIAGLVHPLQQNRNFFAFDFSGLAMPAKSARLVAFNPLHQNGFPNNRGYQGDATETFELSHVQTSVAAVRAGGSGRTDIYSDLLLGAGFGARVVSSADGGRDVGVSLNANGLASVNSAAGSQWVVGGALTSLSNGYVQHVFAYTGAQRARMELTFDQLAWRSASSGFWDSSSAWTMGLRPTTTVEDAIFSHGSDYYVIFNNTSSTARDVIRGGGGTVTFFSSGLDDRLNLGGSLYVGKQQAGIGGGNLTVTGGLDVVAAQNVAVGFGSSASTLTVTGSGSQVILAAPGADFSVGSFAGGFGGTGTLTVESGGTARSAGQYVLGTSAGSTGTINVNAGGTLIGNDTTFSGTSMFVGGYLNAPGGTGTLNVNGGNVELAGTLKVWNSGASSVRLAAGTLNVGGLDLSGNASRLNWTGGTLHLAGGTVTGLTTLAVPTGSTLTGNGTINGHVTNAGTVAPGNSPGTLLITGNYTQADPGSLLFEINGPGTFDFDRLVVTGNADLDGVIGISLGYAPAHGDSFDLVDWASLTDSGYQFDFSDALLAPGLEWDTTAFATSGVLTVVPEPVAALAATSLLSLVALRRRPTSNS